MSNYQKILSRSRHLCKAISLNGYEFDMESDRWILNKDICVNLEFIFYFDTSIQEDILSTLVYFAEQRSASYTSSLQQALNRYQKDTGALVFSELGLLSFKSTLGKKGEPILACLRTFLKQMHAFGYNSLDDTCLELINGWKLSGGERGIPVLSLCPKDGPFSDYEFEAILDGLDNHYAAKRITNEEYMVAQLFAATGRRPIQIAAIKVGDLRVDYQLLGEPTYILNIPRAKVRGRGFRAKFTDYALAEHIAQVVNKHIEHITNMVARNLKRQLTQEEKQLLPLFPNFDELTILDELNTSKSIELLHMDVFHIQRKKLSNILVKTINSLNIISERTKGKIHVHAYRFRYTLGTRAARENCGVLTIATLLDQSDTQHAGVYVQNHPDHAATISAIMNGPLLMYANAFQGKIVLDEDEVLNILPNAQRIRADDSPSNIGSCGTNASCSDHAPIACYLCPKFRPWQDAPHKVILNQLLYERDRIHKETEDLTIASINDRAIIAVTQVINQCYELNRHKESINA